MYKEDKFGDTALDISGVNGHLDVMNYLRSKENVENEFLQDFQRMTVMPQTKTSKWKKLYHTHLTDLRALADMNRIINIWQRKEDKPAESNAKAKFKMIVHTSYIR